METTPLHHLTPYFINTGNETLVTLTSPEEINEKKLLFVKYYVPVYKRETDENDLPTNIKVVRVDEKWIATQCIIRMEEAGFQKEVIELMRFVEEVYHEL